MPDYHAQTSIAPCRTSPGITAPNISTDSTVPVMIEENDLKEEQAMSLVGIMFNQNGVVGFADARNTTIVNGERRFLDDSTQKVFHAPSFVTVTWGTNTYIHKAIPLPLSGLILGLAEGYTGTHRDFTERLKEELKETFLALPTQEYHFLFGFRDMLSGEACYGVEECVITRPGIQYLNLQYGCGARTGGFCDYCPQNVGVYQNWSLSEMEDRCRMLVHSAITLGDAFMAYNPVGGPVRTEILS